MNKYYTSKWNALGKCTLVALFLSISFSLFSQTGYISINSAGAASSNPAILDLSHSSNAHMGLLMPNVSLVSTSDVATIPGPVVGTIIWNTNGALPLGVGYYYWSGTAWLYIKNSGSPSAPTGTGIPNYLAKWTSASTLGTGAAQDNGTGVSISTVALTPVNKLDVNGNAAFGTYAGTAAPVGGVIISGQTGIGTNAPNASAALDITSTTGGLLPPRMTTGQITAIGTPAIGLIVFNSTTNCMQYWSGVSWQSITCQCAGAPATPGGITGTATPCATSGGNVYSITAVAGALYYTWSIPAGATITAGQGTNSITVTMGTSSGNISVTATNSCGTSAASTLAVTASPVPATPGAISGNATPCISSAGNVYTITAVTFATSYNWTVPPGATITANTGTSITVTLGTNPGNITVTAQNACGTSAASTLAVTLGTTPSAPGIITGPATPCASSTGNVYTIASVAGATTYTWSVPAGATITAGTGTTSITVTMGTTNGNITVTAGNACGTSGSSPALAITLSSIPATPGIISGTASYCNQYSTTNHVYTIVAVPGATTYNWTVPAGVGTITAGAGTTSITITLGASYFTGNITVTAQNACGTSAASSLAVTINGTPSVPTVPSGSTTPSTSASFVYTTTAIANATTYTWSTSNTNLATVSLGQGTTSVTILNTATAGTYTICVTAGNACGTSATSCLTVTSSGCVVVHSTFTGTAGSITSWTVPCGITSITITAKGAKGGGSGTFAGRGATVVGTFTVTPGHVMKVLTATSGATSSDAYTGGGGGGSYVWDNNTTTLYVAAGGGGGGNSPCVFQAGAGSSTNATTIAAGGLGTAAGGVLGNGGGGGTGNGAAGGGGWLSNGTGGVNGGSIGGKSPANGGAGGAAGGSYGGAGGFGGGGGAWESGCGAGGGGGGYNGGGGGNGDDAAGQGGGSYVAPFGTGTSMTAGANNATGAVTIVY